MRFVSLWQDHLKTRFLHRRSGETGTTKFRPPAPAGFLTLLAPWTRVSMLWPFFRPNPPLGFALQSIDPCAEQPALSGICLSCAFAHPVSSRRMKKEWVSTPEINSRHKATHGWEVVTPTQPASALMGFWPLRLSPHPPRMSCPMHPPARLPATKPKLHRRRRLRVLRASELAGLSRVCWPLWSSLPRLSKTDSFGIMKARDYWFSSSAATHHCAVPANLRAPC